MRSRLTVTDYNLDWALKEHNLHDRPFPGTLTREEVISYCGTLGVGGIDLMHDYWQDCSTKEVVRRTRDAGILITTLIFGCDLAVPAERRKSSVDQGKGLIDRAVSLGAKLGMIIPGITKSEYPLNEQLLWMTEGLSLCCEHAGRSGLKLVSENIDDPPSRQLMGRGDQCVDVCRRVDSPHYGLIYDSAAALLAGEDPLETLGQMLPHVVHVHLKNVVPVGKDEQWHRTSSDEEGRSYRGVRLDEGMIDISAVLTLLRQRDYEGDFLIEYQGEDNPCEATRDCVDQAEALLARAGFGV